MSQITMRDLLTGLSPERKRRVLAMAARMRAQRIRSRQQEKRRCQ